MATSNRLVQRRVLVALVLIGLLLSAFAILFHAYREGQGLARTQLDTLVRAQWSKLEGGNYRSFVEGLGYEFRDVAIQIESSEGSFRSGTPQWPRVCAFQHYEAEGSSVKEFRIELCRQFNSPAVPLFFLFLVTVALSFLFVLIIRHEAQLRERAALSDLVKRVVHDIRSPLAVIRSLVSQKESEVNREESAMLAGAANRLNQICEDLLSAHRTESIGIRKSTAREVREFLEEKKAELSQRFAKARVEWIVDIDDRVVLPIEFRTLSRVLSNLINNSIEAMNSGESKISISMKETAQHVSLVVADNGSGISEEVLEEFHQGNFRSVGKASGNGLGLQSAVEAIEKVGGKLRILSEVGIGTSVVLTFSLPPKF